MEKSLSQLDLELIWHPFTQMKTARRPIVIERGKDSYLYSEKGESFLDGISSWWVNLHGHAHPKIIEGITNQAKKLEHVIFANFTHSPAIELASKLLPLLPGDFSKIFFSDNGSTAVEAGLKMALQFWYNKDSNTKRKKILCFKGSYHGDTFGAMSVGGKNLFNKPFWNHLFEVTIIDPPECGNEEKTINQLRIILNRDDIAAFIFEPLILGSGGMIVYSLSGLNNIIKLCRDKEIILIADEVMTGFGRTGNLFACEKLDIKPDIICLSKGITGGFLPLGATACCEKIYQEFFSDNFYDAFLHGHSYSGNPLACSSALASLELLLLKECQEKRFEIEVSHKNFCNLWGKHPLLKRCESIGTVLILEYNMGKTSYFNQFKNALESFFLDRGVILRPLGNVLYVMPPYCITMQELQTIYSLIIQTLKVFHE